LKKTRKVSASKCVTCKVKNDWLDSDGASDDNVEFGQSSAPKQTKQETGESYYKTETNEEPTSTKEQPYGG